MNVSELARLVIQSQLEQVQVNLEGCIAGEDPIHLHDLRVATRRLRGALIEFEEVIPPAFFQRYQEDFRWIHNITGEVRDLDVGIAHFPAYRKKVTKPWRDALQPALENLRTKRFQAQIQMAEQLQSERTGAILSSLDARLEEGVFGGSQASLESAREYGSRRIISRYKKLLKSGPQVRKKSPPEVYHNFRISVKKLRYQIEFYSPVLDQDCREKVRLEVKGVQDALGAYQDASVQIRAIRGLADELYRNGAGLEPLLALGQLIGSYEEQIRSNRKAALQQIRWLCSEATSRKFQNCFGYPVG